MSLWWNGRHDEFKIHWLKRRIGSSPISDTWQHIVKCSPAVLSMAQNLMSSICTAGVQVEYGVTDNTDDFEVYPVQFWNPTQVTTTCMLKVVHYVG